MLRTILLWTGILLAGYLPAASSQSQNAAAPPSSTNRALLDRYCGTCHNQRSATAGLALDKLNIENVSEGAAGWEKVVHKLRTGAMPPAGRPRPDGAAHN